MHTCEISLFRLAYDGRSMESRRLQMSYMASLSTMNAQSEWLIVACVVSTALYGSTTAVDTLKRAIQFHHYYHHQL